MEPKRMERGLEAKNTWPVSQRKLEKSLRKQGLKGNSYKFLFGDLKQTFGMRNEARRKPIPFTSDHFARIAPFLHQQINKYGENCFTWFGPVPVINVSEPELIKEAFTRMNEFQKPKLNPLVGSLAPGLASYEGEKWSKHRKPINPAFHMEKLKLMLPAFGASARELISKWDKIVSETGSSEVDVWPYLTSLSADAISRAAFGSSYEEGRKIFELLKEQTELTIRLIQSVYIPGWRTRDYLSAASVDNDFVDKHQDWQARAREEVLSTFGKNQPDFDGLSHLKTVTMILYEVLRLYPAVVSISRRVYERDTKLGNLSVPCGAMVGLSILHTQHHPRYWGDDAKEFKPERFSEGIAKATKGNIAFFPFGWGPRICIGQNFAIAEAKMALSMILQHFSFELSPTYTHAPTTVITLQPQHGAHVILHRLQG